MTLVKKFIISLILSIFLIAIVNISAFYIFYTSYLKLYLAEKIQSRDSITLEYINDVIKKQTIDDIDSIFTDTEIEFFELLEDNEGIIPLNEQTNIDTVVNYLVKSGVASKYIEEVIPTDNFGKIIEALKDKNSSEYKFLNNLTLSILISNLLVITVIIFGLVIFTRKSLVPIKRATNEIKSLNPSKGYKEIEYHNENDEIGLLIGALNSLNKKLNLQEDIRNRLLADISHELKTPITSIQCYLEGISDGVIKLDQKNLDSITSEMKRLISLVNKVMDFEKADNLNLDLDKRLENVSEIIKPVVETHKKKLKENKQRIKVTGDENLKVFLDADLFLQICHNIIGNFLKYSGTNTILRINITRNYIDFSDDGQGIKSAKVPYLTEKFYQGNIEKTGSVSSRGIGVGLSITRKIIYAHNWDYVIKSDTGKGFSFKIIL